MGKDKAFLIFNGETFLSKITKELDGFDEILLSVDSAKGYESERFTVVEDMYPDCGPMGGIYSALTVCRSDYLLVLSCDIPFFENALAKYMCSFVEPSFDAFILTTRDKREQPLCAIYAKRIAPVLQQNIENGRYCLLAALDKSDKVSIAHVPIQKSSFSDDILININTPEDFISLQRQCMSNYET